MNAAHRFIPITNDGYYAVARLRDVKKGLVEGNFTVYTEWQNTPEGIVESAEYFNQRYSVPFKEVADALVTFAECIVAVAVFMTILILALVAVGG